MSVDVTGRDRMARNVLSSWGSYLAMAATGLILPRMMDRHLGQTALGVWDFGWSLISYFSLAHVGVGVSINRHVARHRAKGDVQGLRETASSVLCVSLLAGLLVLALTAAATWAVPWMLKQRPDGYLAETRWVVALLGASLAMHVTFDLFPGVLAGSHRWDLQNAITAGFHLATIAAMIAVLLAGGGLRGLALAYLCGQIGADLTRLVVAYRICPELRIRFADATAAQARKILAFGAKSAVGGLSFVLLFQGNSLIVASHLGLPMLALFARPLALLKVAQTFADKFALVLTPIASSLQGAGRHAEVRQLVIESTRFGTALAAPMTLGLAILGDPILRLWMGPRYEQGLALAILAMGAFLPLTQVPVASILTGLNLHGTVSVTRLTAAAFGVALGFINVRLLGWGLVGAALAVAIPFTIGSGIFIPLYVCRRLAIPVREYVRQGLLVPIACALPFALVLAGSRTLLAGRPLLSVLCGSAAGALVLAPLYWRYVLPGRVRDSIRGRWVRLLGRLDSRPA